MMGARLIARGDEEPRRDFSFSGGRVTIGSASENRLVLDNETISRRHAILDVNEGSCRLSDAGSTNGTFVNGRRVNGAMSVRDGDELRFGALSYVFQTDTLPIVHLQPALTGWSLLKVAVPMVLILFAGAIATSMFLINFSRLEIASLAQATGSASSALPATQSSEESGPKPWLDALNRYRAAAGLPPVNDNPGLGAGAALHSRYVVTNYGDQISQSVNLGSTMHLEDPSKPGFTPEGKAAGLAGDVDELWDPAGTADVSWAIDNWMLAPFHRLSLLDPRLRSVGYGDYCEKGVCVATLDARGGADPSSPVSPAPVIKYPADGSSITGEEFTAEWPDPLTSCSGYTSPTGLPITLQLGPLITPIISIFSLTRDGDASPIEGCGIDANSYENPDAATQMTGRGLLHEYGAVIIVPRNPLAAGLYTVKLRVNGIDYDWSFTVKP
jgi:hypothetical protein